MSEHLWHFNDTIFIALEDELRQLMIQLGIVLYEILHFARTPVYFSVD